MIVASREAKLLLPQRDFLRISHIGVHENRALFSSTRFMNSNLFLQWLKYFNDRMPYYIKIPVMLIFDVCAAHYNLYIINKDIEIKMILVLFSEMFTHLVQPLDIAVFKTFTTTPKEETGKHIIDTRSTPLAKREAIKGKSQFIICGDNNKDIIHFY